MAVIQGLLQDARLVTPPARRDGQDTPGTTDRGRAAEAIRRWYLAGRTGPVVRLRHGAHLAARALGLREQTGSQMMILLQEYLEKRQVLLILDNCEHVIEACARLAEALLQACPKLSI